jgi:putative Ca2+/H+ antiporter (TMEM165/GDT1 family)
MMLANAPAVWMGKVLADRINMTMMRWIAAASFVLLGIWSLAGEVPSY